MEIEAREVKHKHKATPLNTIVSGIIFLFLPYMISNSMVDMSSYKSEGLGMILIISFCLAAVGYLYPSLTALKRKHPKRLAIIIFNLVGLLVFIAVNELGQPQTIEYIEEFFEIKIHFYQYCIYLTLSCWMIALALISIPINTQDRDHLGSQ